jgi:hypothetical protein
MRGAQDNDLSAHLGNLLAFFSGHLDGVHLSADQVKLTVEQIAILQRLARLAEQELAVHRLGEASKAGAAALEQSATEAMGHLVIETDGKVIKPNFGGRLRRPD